MLDTFEAVLRWKRTQVHGMADHGVEHLAIEVPVERLSTTKLALKGFDPGCVANHQGNDSGYEVDGEGNGKFVSSAESVGD